MVYRLGQYSQLYLGSELFQTIHLDNDLGDTIYVFDNKHRVEKTWSVKRNNKVKASGITNVAVVALKEDSQ